MRRYTLYNRITIRLLALAMAVLLVLGSFPAVSAAEYEGSCGDGLNWSFEGGTLTITGSGDMRDYKSLESIPWYSFRDQILRLELPEGLTSVGEMAFYDCYNLTAIVMPSTVTDIGRLAFCQCRSATVLKLNDGLRSIGESAFDMCAEIQDLRLPSSLERLGRHAFYFCNGLRYVTIPESVQVMGDGVFAYCKNLIRADVKAPLAELPRWTFYGCTALNSISLSPECKGVGEYGVYGCESLYMVYYGGEEADAERLKEQISEGSSDFNRYGTITDEDSGDSETHVHVEIDEQGNMVAENIDVTQTENATVSITGKSDATNLEPVESEYTITAAIHDDAGWDQLLEQIDQTVSVHTVYVTVYVMYDTEVPRRVLDRLAGRNISMTVYSVDGSSYVLNLAELKDFEVKQTLNFSYKLMQVMDTGYQELEGITAYKLMFDTSSVIMAELMIQLPVGNAKQSATLYIKSGNGLKALQSVVVDEKNVAHFYLGSVESKKEYFIGIGSKDAVPESLIIPGSLEADYGIDAKISNVEYVITGRKSSWNMGLGQVTWILAGVMGVSVVAVGVLMFALNKRKLKMGAFVYDEDEDEE